MGNSKTKLLLTATILLITSAFSCSHVKKNKNETIIADTLTKTIDTISKNQTNYFPIKWTNISDVNDSWISLERDDKGYLIYKPCNGSTPRIVIDSGVIAIHWQLDAPDKFRIEKFTAVKDPQGILFSGYNHEIQAQFMAEVVNPQSKLVLWTWTTYWDKAPGEKGEYKWLTTPAKFEKEFRVVDNPCPTEMKVEKQFLPIEF